MLYPKNKEKTLNKELFKNPTAEYRGAPFWGWNCELKKETLEKQIDYLKIWVLADFICMHAMD